MKQKQKNLCLLSVLLLVHMFLLNVMCASHHDIKNLPNFRTLPPRHFESKAQPSSKICIGQSRNLCHDSLHEASKIAPHNFSLALSLAKKQGHSMPPASEAEFDEAKSLCENCLHMKTPCHGLIGKIWLLVNFRQ